MYTPTAGEVADAFELGDPGGELVHVRRGDADAWLVETATGRYFVKGYIGRAHQLREQLEVAMDSSGGRLMPVSTCRSQLRRSSRF